MRRRLSLLLIPLLALGILGVMLWSWQGRLIYFPGGAPPPIDEVLPGGRDVTLETSDGLQLSAWFLPPAAADGPAPGVVVLPGNAGNRGGRAPLARGLADAGMAVLLLDYRGYGGNPGTPSERGLRADAAAAADWLAAQPVVDRLVYLGESLGAAVAVRLALDRPPAAVVLRSPFQSLGSMARLHYGPVPDWVLRDRFPVEALVGELDVPLLVVAGERDNIVPAEQSRRVFDAAREPKRFVVVPDAGHNDALITGGIPLLDAVAAFVARHAGGSPGAG